MRTKKYVTVLVVVIASVLVYMFLGAIEDKSNKTTYAEAKIECPVHLWLIYDDIGPTVGPQVKPPYPTDHRTIVGSKKIFSYGCTLDEATKKQESLSLKP